MRAGHSELRFPFQRVAHTWGSTAKERLTSYPCDNYVHNVDDAYFRAIDIGAPAALLFRWLCQLKVAPYSYDRIDNCGRRSPQCLTPGLESLALGQKVLKIFTLVEYEVPHHLTLLLTDPNSVARFGEISVSYVITAATEDTSRLIGKLIVRYQRNRVGSLMRWLLPRGDLVMARKQFLTLKKLAERDYRKQRDSFQRE